VKNLKKFISFVLVFSMAVTLLYGCSSSKGDEEADIKEDTQSTVKTDESKDSTANAEEPITLKLFGPGLLTELTETGSIDLVSGIELPGYEVLIKRWNELYPNVTLEIETIPWDNWQAAIQTAALSGDVDIIMHGASLADLAEPLDSYIEKETGLMDQIFSVAQRRTDTNGDLSIMTTTGMSYAMNPMIAMLDKQIFEDYGVALPDENWTWEDAITLAEQMTGTDPVTGKQTWGTQLVETGAVGNRFFNYQLISSAYDAKTITYGKTVAESKVDFTGEGTTKAFQVIADLAQFCSPDVKEGINVIKTITAENDTAIRWDQGAFRHYNEIKAFDGEDRFVYMTMPAIEAGENQGSPSLFMGDHNMAISNTSKNKEWAWKFLKFLVTDEVIQQWLVDTMQLPNNRKSMEVVSKAMGENYGAVVTRALEQNPVGFNNSTNDYVNNVSFGAITSDMGNVIGELLLGNMTAEEAGVYIQNNVDAYMKAAE
jgi:ABC-type glycerol-3-phosphate transport system substrate-binding protein